jgi:hypothetical protein
MKQVDMLVCIRCHNHLAFVVDTYQAAKAYCSDSTEVVFAVDGECPGIFAKKLVSFFGEEKVFIGAQRYGWGAGLYGLLVESIKHFRHYYKFHHFQSIDYDTLFIGPEADRAIMDQITSPSIGLLGCYQSKNAHWEAVYHNQKKIIHDTFGDPGPKYRPGEGVQGGCMTLTAALLAAMEERGMMDPPFSIAKEYVKVADDHLLPIFVRMCDLKIRDVSHFAECHWRARRDPRGIEKKGIKVFHPTKIRPGNSNRSTEVEIRNYFRGVRKAPDLLR